MNKNREKCKEKFTNFTPCGKWAGEGKMELFPGILNGRVLNCEYT